MSTDSKIEWTDQTWNPTSGCDRVSPGCDNCYALKLAGRLKKMGQAKYQHDGDPSTSGPGFGLTMHEDGLSAPFGWRKPRRVFVNSMSDLFHKDVSDDFIARVFAVMAVTPQHTYQVLSKRHGRMRALLSGSRFHRLVADIVPEYGRDPDLAQDYVISTWPLPNVWAGVSVESQEWANVRIPALLGTLAAVRFISAEPLLGPVDLGEAVRTNRYACHACEFGNEGDCNTHRVDKIGWMICGGESGPGARPMELSWARGLVRQCKAAGVAPFVKQLGSRWGKNHHDIEAFPEDLRVREYPEVHSVR